MTWVTLPQWGRLGGWSYFYNRVDASTMRKWGGWPYLYNGVNEVDDLISTMWSIRWVTLLLQCGQWGGWPYLYNGVNDVGDLTSTTGSMRWVTLPLQRGQLGGWPYLYNGVDETEFRDELFASHDKLCPRLDQLLPSDTRQQLVTLMRHLVSWYARHNNTLCCLVWHIVSLCHCVEHIYTIWHYVLLCQACHDIRQHNVACQVCHDTWHMTHDTWHMTHDTWHMTHDTWHMTHDTWHRNVVTLCYMF